MAEKQLAEQEFYVGYLPTVPSGIARRIRMAVILLFIAAACIAAGFAAVQRTFAPSIFEFGKEHAFEGILETRPYPTLLVRRPGAGAGQPQYSRYLLVAAGKHGADAQAAGLSGKLVQLRGSLIYRDGQTMIELAGEPISPLTEEAIPAQQTETLGTMELTGEIVDSKCNFGVMNPGEGKVHKDCAVRCLSGGIPPAFVTQDLMGAPAVLLLAGPSQEPLGIAPFLPYVARPVRLRGKVLSLDGTLLLELDPGSLSPVR